jgi:NADPH:quinone reductase-like Zn-dependent oxidoreductase/SAM-dependent methyltransferase
VRKKLDLSHRKQLGVNILLEIGPHATLRGPIRDLLETLSWGQDVNYYPALRRGENAATNLLSALGYLHCSGSEVDLGRANKLIDASQNQPRVLVDLPEYPFNHSVSYWRESRISKQSRLGKKGRLDLLGKPVVDWNPLEARWRHHIRCSEMPWVGDHAINGALIYPAAGMLVMAIEAANQLADPGLKVTGFQLKDVQFLRALTVPMTADGIETNLLLRTTNDNSNSARAWSEFRLFSFENDNWQENCHGLIRVDYEVANPRHEETRDLNDCLEQDALIEQSCTTDFNQDQLYQCLRESGFQFGPTFHTILEGKSSIAHQARSLIQVYSWPEDQYPQPHVVHPTTLDGILHLSAAALSEGGRCNVPTAIPTGLRRLWVAKEGLSRPTADAVHAAAWIKMLHHRGHEFDIFAMNDLRTRVLAKVEGLQSTIVANNTRKSTESTQNKLTSYHVGRILDLDFLTTDQLVAYCLQSNPHGVEPVDFFRDLNFILYRFLDQALDSLREFSPKDLSLHIRRYADWARLQRSRYQAGQLPLSRPEWTQLSRDSERFEEMCGRVAATNSLGKAYVHTGRNLPSILRGEQDPLQFLFKDDMMIKFYQEVNNRPVCFEPWGRFLRTRAQKNPTMRILEIGAGTGATTDHILHALSVGSGVSKDKSLYMTYDYTDISPAFFEQAAERYKTFPRMNFIPLDITDDPSKQGLNLESYDLVVAANVLHATADIATTMRNVRKLLKPRGRLMMYEDIRPDITRAGFIAGLMEGWWVGKEDYRAWGAALTTSQWDTVLKETGFTGVDLELPEYLDQECQETAILVSTASGSIATDRVLTRTIYFVHDPSSVAQRNVYDSAHRSLRAQYPNYVIEGGDIKQCASSLSLTDTTLIFVQEIETPLLSGMTRETFLQLQHLVNHCHSMLWVTAGGGHYPNRPDYSIVDGWARTLRSEKANRRISTVALDVEGQVSQNQIQHIVRILADVVLDTEQAVYEPEFVEVDGMLHVVRITPDTHLTDELYAASLPRQATSKPLGEAGPVKLVYTTAGLLDTLHWVDDDDAHGPLPEDEVEIEVKAVGLNFKDSQIVLGEDVEMNIGHECSGVVTHAGHLSGLSPGDRVATFGPGKFRSRVRGKSNTVCRIPNTMPFIVAASIPAQFGATWHAIVNIARLETGQAILIHAGAIGSGQAAIQIAQFLGAEIYATTSSEQNTQILVDEYSIPADHIFHDEDTTFAREVMRMTKGQGVDMILSTLADEMLFASWECVAPYGHLVHIGSNKDASNNDLSIAQSCRQASFTHFDSYAWMRDRPSAAKRAIETVMNLFESQKLHVQRPLNVEIVDKIEEMLAFMQSGTFAGKSVVKLAPQARVPTMLRARVPFQLNPNATYIIAGGLGGLGRTIARWMTARGARHLALLGRSGAKTQDAIELIEELRAQRVHVNAPACDVIDAVSVRKVLQEIQQTMPPVKGCVQGSMVLRDQMFSEMSYEDWRAVVECKALGSWNLEMNLPTDLDFFVLLSSASAVIGLTGQSNYAAGNSYMDGFARYRVANGQKAISLDLGAMVDDGLLVETPGFLEKVLGYGSLAPVSRAQFLGVLDYYCDPNRPLSTPGTAQMVLGISAGGDRYLESTLVDKPLFCRLKLDNVSDTSVVKEGGQLNFQKLFVAATSLEEGREVIAKALIDKLTHSYRVLPEHVDVDIHAPLYTFRIDSLLAVELCNWIAKEFVAELAVLEVMGGATLDTVNLMVATRSQLKHAPWA